MARIACVRQGVVDGSGDTEGSGVEVGELQTSLRRASEASARIRTLVPRVSAISKFCEDLEPVIRSGRGVFGAPASAAAQPPEVSRRTLLMPGTGTPAPAPLPPPPPSDDVAPAWQPETVGAVFQTEAPADAPPPADEERVSFRLEFESASGPLDLRAVDEAVSQQPAVRDVALLDYDGRRATLKVWIASTSTPADVQASLAARAPELFPPGSDINFFALEDVA